MAIEAVIFDFDGLILDTESHEYHAWAEIYQELGVELPYQVWGKCIGTDASAFDVYAYLEELTGYPVDRDKIRKDRLDRYNFRMVNEDVRPGVRAYLASAQAMGLRIGLASSSSRAWVTGYLEAHQLLSYFETICTKEDVKQVKPDPELYRRALANLGVDPANAIAFEDSPNGSLAAKRAGMNCVIVPNSVTENLVFGEVDYRLSSMQQMTLPDLIAIFK